MARYQILFAKKAVSSHEIDEVQARAKMPSAHNEQAQAGLGQARAAEAQARAMLSLTRIRAPFDGAVTAKNVDPGALASPGVPLLNIEDAQRFRVEASVDEHNIRAVKVGTSARVILDAFGGEMQGKVAQVVPAADPASRSFVVKVDLPGDARLRSGVFARVQFSNGRRDAVLLPRTAVLDRGQLQAVYAVSPQNVASLRFVTVGKASGDQVEVLSGIESGERIVVQPGDRELSGKRIEGRL